MTNYFVYLWFDKQRKMFYIGSHCGHTDDGYTCSSRWMSGEIRFRPNDFKRRIVKYCTSKEEMLQLEYRLICKIKEEEFGVKYYNIKIGKPKGIASWNKGQRGVYSQETIKKMSDAKRGNTATKGMAMPKSAENGKKSAAKMSATVTGRRKVIRNGKSTWAYPTDIDYPK